MEASEAGAVRMWDPVVATVDLTFLRPLANVASGLRFSSPVMGSWRAKFIGFPSS